MKNCPICGGDFEPGFTTFSNDTGDNLTVLRKVPALICSNCGEEFIENNVVKQIEEKLNSIKGKNSQIEIQAFC